MKRIYCASGDGKYICVPDEVKAVVELLGLMVWIHKCEGSGYIDAADKEEGPPTIELDMYPNTPNDRARALFIEWVRNGCVERRVGYD